MGPKFSVLCHTATEPLVSHHGLRKYWHFVFFMKEVLPYTYKQKGWGGREEKGGSKKLGFKDNRLKAKEYRALTSSKKNIRWLIADLYAL